MSAVRSLECGPSVLRRWSGRALFAAIVLIWILAVGTGVRILWRYANTPGTLASPPVDWPRRAGIQPKHGRAVLLVFAHPQCPCSRATIGELALIMARCRGKFDAYVFFYAPRSEGSAWARTELWQQAASIPDVHAVEDPDGAEALRFSASTSGQALLYDTRGRLLFNGGITAARGHSGANDGRDAVVSLLEGRPARPTTPVFGCSLLGASS